MVHYFGLDLPFFGIFGYTYLEWSNLWADLAIFGRHIFRHISNDPIQNGSAAWHCGTLGVASPKPFQASRSWGSNLGIGSPAATLEECSHPKSNSKTLSHQWWASSFTRHRKASTNFRPGTSGLLTSSPGTKSKGALADLTFIGDILPMGIFEKL